VRGGEGKSVGRSGKEKLKAHRKKGGERRINKGSMIGKRERPPKKRAA